MKRGNERAAVEGTRGRGVGSYRRRRREAPVCRAIAQGPALVGWVEGNGGREAGSYGLEKDLVVPETKKRVDYASIRRLSSHWV